MLPHKIIDALGGTLAVARMCEVKPPAVSQWKKKGIPKAQLRYLTLLHPEVFEAIARKTKGRA